MANGTPTVLDIIRAQKDVLEACEEALANAKGNLDLLARQFGFTRIPTVSRETSNTPAELEAEMLAYRTDPPRL